MFTGRAETPGREMYCQEISYSGTGGVACWLEPDHLGGMHYDLMLNVWWKRGAAGDRAANTSVPPKAESVAA